MRFAFPRSIFERKSQVDNRTNDHAVRELTQDELARLYGGHGKDCCHHHHHHCDYSCNNNCDYYYSCCSNYYCCYTY